LYGHSGTGKSEGIVAVIRETLKQRPGKKARVWVGDGSAVSYHESGLVDDGLVEVFSWEGRDYPISTLNLIAEGYKPEDPADPKSKLIAPTPAEMASISVWAFEGLSVAGNYVMGGTKGGLAYRGGKGEKIGQDSPIRIVDGEVDKLGNPKDPAAQVHGGNPLAHFGVAQRMILGFIERTKALPGDFVFTTAHERSAEDKVTKETIIGPEAAGGALTPVLQRYYGNTLHFVIAEKRSKSKDEFNQKLTDDLDTEHRIYTRAHISASTFQKYTAVTRGGLTEEEMPAYIVSANPGDGLLEFYNRLATAKAKRRSTMTVPALPAAA
jgi:hypothetical protein